MMIKNRIVLLVSFTLGILGCDIVAPNHGTRDSVYTSKDGFEVRIKVEPENVRAGQVFYITTTAKNVGSVPITITAPYGRGSGGVPVEYLAVDRYLVFNRVDGQPHQISTGNTPSLCMMWSAPEQVGGDVRKTLAAGEKLVDCRIEYVAQSATDHQPTPAGAYHVTWSPEIKVQSPTSETLPVFAIDFEIKN